MCVQYLGTHFFLQTRFTFNNHFFFVIFFFGSLTPKMSHLIYLEDEFLFLCMNIYYNR